MSKDKQRINGKHKNGNGNIATRDELRIVSEHHNWNSDFTCSPDTMAMIEEMRKQLPKRRVGR